MRNDRTIQTRRKAPKSTFTMLYAATRSTKRRKQRAATAHPEDLGEVPGVGIARALVVILLIHVAAIAGIYLHNKDSKSADLKAAAAIVAKKETPPKPREGFQRGFPDKGDNYQTMALRFGVDESELRRVNDDKPIRVDWLYNIPARRTEATSPSESRAGRVNPPAEIQTPAPIEHPEIGIADLPPPSVSDLPERQPTAEPVLIKPHREPIDPEIENAPKAQIVSSSSTYTVKKGDTLWGISQRNGVSVDALMSLNGIDKAKGLQIGKTLKIPAQR